MVKQEQRTFFARAKSWASKRGLFGPQAYLRYVMFTFLDCLFEETDRFIFKGGNLLWIYIKTPRHTIDLDLVTFDLKNSGLIKGLVRKACARGKQRGINFRVSSFVEKEQKGETRAAVTIEYKTEEGASNKFELDIIYFVQTRSALLDSPVDSGKKIRAAAIEEIISDKLMACQRFRGGNTRMKDFDDLYRICKSGLSVKWAVVRQLLRERRISRLLDKSWLNVETLALWCRHSRRYKDLPEELTKVFSNINLWLRKNLS